MTDILVAVVLILASFVTMFISLRLRAASRRIDKLSTLINYIDARIVMQERGPTDVLERAERFISGFAGDEMQEGVDDLLEDLRSYIAFAKAK